MASGTMEVANGEGGDDRDEAVALVLIQQKLHEVPELDLREVYDYLALQAVEAAVEPTAEVPEPAVDTTKAAEEVRGGRGMIYSDTVPVVLGSRALERSVYDATRFRPAGTGNNRALARMMGQPQANLYARRRNGRPPINGIF